MQSSLGITNFLILIFALIFIYTQLNTIRGKLNGSIFVDFSKWVLEFCLFFSKIVFISYLLVCLVSRCNGNRHLEPPDTWIWKYRKPPDGGQFFIFFSIHSWIVQSIILVLAMILQTPSFLYQLFSLNQLEKIFSII